MDLEGDAPEYIKSVIRELEENPYLKMKNVTNRVSGLMQKVRCSYTPW